MPAKIEHIEGTEQQKSRAFSPAVITEGGRIVWLAGKTTTTDVNGKDISGKFEEQARTVFELLGRTLERAGGSLAQSADYVTASGMPLKSGSGECVRTGYWTPDSDPCEQAVTHLALHDVPRMPPARVAYAVATLFAFNSDELDDEACAELDKL